MRNIPVPVMVGVVVAALLVLAVVLYRGIVRPAGGSGDVNAITAEIVKNNPKNAPEVPDNMKPAARAVMAGSRKKAH